MIPWHRKSLLTRTLAYTVLLIGTSAQFGLQAQENAVVRFPIRGTIADDFDERVQRVLVDAQARGAHAVILDIDAWQGPLGSVQTALGWILDAEVPVYAFVSGIAHETGALVALGADSIYMTPNASIGGQVPGIVEIDASLANPVERLRTEFHRLVALRGLDAALGDAMADAAVAIPGLVDESAPLTLTAQAAVDLHLASAIVEHIEEAMARLALADATIISASERGLTGATIEIQNNSWRDVRVFLVRGSNRRRLGLITSLGRREYVLQHSEIGFGTDVRLVADPVGGAPDHVSQTIRMVPGIVIQWNLHNNPAQSSIFIFRP